MLAYRRVVILLGLAIILVAIASTARLFLTSPLGTELSYLLFPPADLYSPLARADIDLSQDGSTCTVRFANKYPGLHEFAILVEKPASASYEGDFVLDLRISNERTAHFAKTIHGPGSPFWGGPSFSGFTVAEYESPTMVPLHEPLTATVTVRRGDVAFQERHGRAQIVVRKRSTE